MLARGCLIWVVVLACACTSLRTNRAGDAGEREGDSGSAGSGGSAGDEGDASLGREGGAGEGGAGAGSSSGGIGGEAASSGGGGQSGDDALDAAEHTGPGDGECDGGACDARTGECASCVPEPPSGWLGPVVLADTDVNDCGGAFPILRLDLKNSLGAPSASCTCQCGSPVASCGPIKFRQGAPTACGAAGGTDTTIAAPNTCVEVAQMQSCGRGAFAAAATNAGCTPLATETIEPASWGTTLRLCAGTVGRGGCSADQLCMPDIDPEYLADACIYREGLHGCPLEWPNGYAGYKALVDDRDCSACTCEVSGTPECTAELKVFSDRACTMMTESTNVTGTVASAVLGTLDPMYMLYKAPFVSGVTCTPNGGEPIGSVSPIDKYTVCCQ